MEDAEKRKQLLNAMRMEAAQCDVSTSLETSVNPGHLSNPLAETSTHQHDSSVTSRFGYYTDPMSAYSSSKRNKTYQHAKQQHTSSSTYQISSPVSQFQPSAPGSLDNDYQEHPKHGGFQAAHYDGNQHAEPRGRAHLSPSPRGSPAAWSNFGPPPVNQLRPYQVHPNYGGFQAAPYPSPFSQANPDMGNRFGDHDYNTLPTPVHAPQFSNYGRQNYNCVGNTYLGSGRGRGRGYNMNTGFGRGGGRQQRYERPVNQKLGAERFYANSMTEDPWKDLKPIPWKSYSDASSSSSTGQAWLPKSIEPSKPMISEASHKPSNNQQSLAEYLAASLDEAKCDDSSN